MNTSSIYEDRRRNLPSAFNNPSPIATQTSYCSQSTQATQYSSSKSSYQSESSPPSSMTSSATFTSTYSQAMAAPLPSPAANQPSQPTQYFNSAYSQTSKQLPAQRQIAQQTVQYPPQGHPEAQGQSLFDSAQQPPPYDYSQARGGMNDPTASSPFIRDFNLVAEAAKRAQMAVLMRDMEGVAL